MTEEEIVQHKKEIDAMSHEQMARLYRSAPSGHPYFDRSNVLCDYFFAKWDKLGGWNPELSKKIGWG